MRANKQLIQVAKNRQTLDSIDISYMTKRLYGSYQVMADKWNAQKPSSLPIITGNQMSQVARRATTNEYVERALAIMLDTSPSLLWPDRYDFETNYRITTTKLGATRKTFTPELKVIINK